MTHPSSELDDVVHQRVRLGVLAILAEAPKVDFAHLRTTLDLTDGNLSRHLAVLEQAGYVVTDKTVENRRTRTWVTLTKTGRTAFDAEVDALRRLLGAAGGRRGGRSTSR